MTHNDADTEESTDTDQPTADERRAQWERMSMAVCPNGVVNVRNDSHGSESSKHIYSVSVENGAAVGCSCPHATHRGAHCKHQVAVEQRPIVLTSANAAASTANA